MDDARARKLAENEALAREVNEQVEAVAKRWHNGDEPAELICECSRETCTERVHVPLADYRRVREDPTRFLVVPSHVVAEIEDVVGEAGDATIVEKRGPGRQVAEDEAAS